MSCIKQIEASISKISQITTDYLYYACFYLHILYLLPFGAPPLPLLNYITINTRKTILKVASDHRDEAVLKKLFGF